MGGSLELTWNLPHARPSSITLTLGIRGISKPSPGNGHVFMVHQKPETLNQNNHSLQCILACKTAWQKDVLYDTLQFPVPLR